MKMRLSLILVLSIVILVSMHAQSAKYDSTKIYRVNTKVSAGLVAVGVFANTIGLPKVQDKPDISAERSAAFSRDEIRGIDRWALQQDPSKKNEAEKISDWGMKIGLSMPVWLFLDKEIRKDFWDISLLYLETQVLSSNIYTWSPLGPTFVSRFRPLVYYPELPIEERNFGRVRNSFFSGHTSSTAAGTFFTAKIYSDYHPELGSKKWIIYGLAAIPPAAVGYYRIRALKHFPTDVLVGYIVGASLGVVVPELHRRLQGRLRVAALYSEFDKGLSLSWKF